MKKIKWENIIFILSICYSVQAMIHHISLNGITSYRAIEVIMYVFMCYGIRYVVWYFRKHTKEVINYIKDICVD